MPDVEKQPVTTVLDQVLALKWCPDYKSYYDALDPAIAQIRAKFGTALDTPVLDSANAKTLRDTIQHKVLKAQGFPNPFWRWVIDDKALTDVIATIQIATSEVQA